MKNGTDEVGAGLKGHGSAGMAGPGKTRPGGEEKKPLALYIHIPFCVRKCAYCDFLSGPASEGRVESYVNLLCEEIEREAVCYPGYRGRTVFFGGGTPTVLKTEQLVKILCKLKKCFFASADMEQAEITLECNPGTVRGEDLKKLRGAGFNRLSIGLQSAWEEELKKLGRIHTWEDFLRTYHMAREAGFRNINVDLMAALPGQRVSSYVNSLQKVAALRPEHISAYSLMIEEGTPFYERYGEADAQRRKYGEDKEHLLPSEEEERRMYEQTGEILGQCGYHRYEISNYSLPGCECRHNLTYWKRGDYLGLGLGAASLMENCRFTKTKDPGEYERQLDRGEGKKSGLPEGGDLHRDLQQLSVREQMEEFMFLGLRLTEGISRREFENYFHVRIDSVYGEILKKLGEQGLIEESGDRLWLTEWGVAVSNAVLAEFLLPQSMTPPEAAGHGI